MRRDRLVCNMEIIRILTQAAENNPDLRFGQLLSALNIVQNVSDSMTEDPVWKDEFYLESNELLNRIKF